MIHILDQDRENVRGIREWIFEPQSEVENFRKYLSEHDFQIVKEDMVEEDGKFYPVMKAVRESGKTGDVKDELSYRYGALLLREKHPVLHRYLVREKEMKETIIRSLSGRTGGRIEERKEELEYDLRLIGEALGRYEE